MVVSEKKSAVKLHIATLRHTRAKERLVADSKRQVGVLESLRKYESENIQRRDSARRREALSNGGCNTPVGCRNPFEESRPPPPTAGEASPSTRLKHTPLQPNSAVRQMEFEKTKQQLLGEISPSYLMEVRG